MKGKRYLTPFIALLTVSILALSITIGQVTGQQAAPGGGPGAPEAPDADPSIYLPMIVKAPNTIFGRVTDDGIAAAGVELDLWHYAGAIWSPIDTTTTDTNGNYRFTNMDALLPGEKYGVEYYNVVDPNRLGIWDTRELTSFPDGSVVNIGDFDIANVELTLPTAGSEVVPPSNFQWTPRPTTPSDSYQFSLFDYYDHIPSFDSPLLGYAGSYTLGSLPPGFLYCNPYTWGVAVNSPDGGWGFSYWVRPVTLHQTALSGIHGCVTESGVPRYNVPVKLWRYNGPDDWDSWSTTTNTNGYFAFTGRSGLSAPQFYVVEYYNNSNPSRVGVYDTRTLAPYTSSSSVHIGDFDIANIVLTSPAPGATVSIPVSFQWIRRPATQLDDYTFDLFDLTGGVPDFIADSLGYVNQYDLTFLPGGYSYGVTYGWGILVDDVFGGWGASYYYNTVTFSPTAMSAAPAEGPGELQWEPQQLEAIRLTRLGKPQDQLQLHPDFKGMRGQK